MTYRIVVDRLPQLLAIVLAILVVYRLAMVVWALWSAPVAEIVPAIDEVAPDTRISIVPSRSIAELSLFGRVESPVPAVPVEQTRIAESRLNLTLYGVFEASDQEHGVAIIGDSSGNDGSYTVGMLVPGGAVLAEVHDRYVLLKREGRTEKLSLPQDPDANQILVNAGAVGSGTARNGSSVLSYRPPPAVLVRPDTRTNGAILSDMRRVLAEDPARVLENMRVDPIRDGDHLVGYRLNPARDRQLLSRFGLVPGDIVTGVNGVLLNSADKGPEIVRALLDANQLSLDVMRNGISKTITFKVD